MRLNEIKKSRESIYTLNNKIVLRFFCAFLFLALWLNMGLAEEGIRSSSLYTIITSKDNVERIDFVNDKGEITYAANKHYASIIKTKNNNIVLEEFYDDEGKPAKQAYDFYKVLKEYNDEGLEYKTTYLDINGNNMMIHPGYCMILRTYNKYKQITKESYMDIDEKPVLTKSFGYGCYRKYDDEGNNNTITYFDKNGLPMVCGQGFATVKRQFYDYGVNKGRVQYSYYYDEDNQPVQLGKGQYGELREYDEFGRTTQIFFLNSSGQIITTKDGYSSIKYAYYADDSIKSESYYDRNGNPARLSEGQYGLMNIHGKRIYLDKQGNEVFNLRNLLYNSQKIVIIFGIVVIILSLIFNRKINIILIGLYIGFIVYMSLMNRTTSGYGLQLELFWSYRQIFDKTKLAQEILNNIWLFVPLGVMLYRLVPNKLIIVILILLSISIEFIQYWMKLGLCEWDDVFSNSLGGFIGYLIAAFIEKKKV